MLCLIANVPLQYRDLVPPTIAEDRQAGSETTKIETWFQMQTTACPPAHLQASAIGRLALGDIHCYDLNTDMEGISSRSVGIGAECFVTGNAVYMWKPVWRSGQRFSSGLH